MAVVVDGGHPRSRVLVLLASDVQVWLEHGYCLAAYAAVFEGQVVQDDEVAVVIPDLAAVSRRSRFW